MFSGRSSSEFRIGEEPSELVGNTPLVALPRLGEGLGAELVVKLESLNPGGSVKDRIGVAMRDAAERDGLIERGRSVIVEPTSGNTGIALAMVCASRGYHLIVTLPEGMSKERAALLRTYGAVVRETPSMGGMDESIELAAKIAAEHDEAFMPQQFNNPANPAIHRLTTAEEIWKDTGGAVDVVVSGIGTGGTLTGVGAALKAYKPEVRMVAVEPEDSPVLSGGPPGAHKIQGIGAGFIPEVLDTALIDEVIRIGNDTAFTLAREAARIEGLPVGISSGAALAAALEVGARPGMKGKMIVTILPSFAERYLTTDLFEGM